MYGFYLYLAEDHLKQTSSSTLLFCLSVNLTLYHTLSHLQNEAFSGHYIVHLFCNVHIR